MLRIQRSFSGGAVFSLSGRIEIEDVGELQRLLSLEASGERVALDLRDITLVGRDALQFLARCEAENIKLENCPAYIREWIDAEKGGRTRQKP
jgi:anti-anti-sigma regulatory factor